MINKTKIRYDIDQIRFKIEDKKQTKAARWGRSMAAMRRGRAAKDLSAAAASRTAKGLRAQRLKSLAPAAGPDHQR